MKSFSKIKSLLCFFLISFLIIPLISCDNGATEKEVSRGYIWEATNENTTITLIGTIHIGDNKVNFFNDNIKKIIDETDVLSVELDLSQNETIKNVQSSGYLKNGETIENYLSEDEIEKLSSIFKSLSPNFNIGTIKYLTPSSLNSLLTVLCYSKAGILGNGLDLLIINEMNSRKSKGDDVVINELEGCDLQIDIGNKTFTWDYLKKYLATHSDSNINEEVNNSEKLFNAYKNGDIEFIEKVNNEMKSNEPETYKIMLTDRNINMVNKIVELTKDGKKHTIAVGAGHFIGEDNMLKLLEDKGYKITRIN